MLHAEDCSYTWTWRVIMKSPGGKVGEETSPVNKKKKEKANKQAT